MSVTAQSSVRLLAAGVLLLALVAAASPVPARADPPARRYVLHVPKGGPGNDRPLVVYLHGCAQTAKDAERATGFSELADQLNFVVVYPQQNVTEGTSAPLADGNGAGCWNWFLPEHQRRGAGEPAAIADITRRVIDDERIDPDRVHIAGISAGADMAVIMAAAYPDLYASAAVLAGCPYATCSDASGVLAYKAAPSDERRVVPMFVAQGTADHVNSFALGEALVQSWLGTIDLADDGVAGSVRRIPSASEDHGFDQSPRPGSGDPCIRNANWPCPGGIIGFQGTYPYTVQRYSYEGRDYCNVLDFWIVHGLGHAQPNADSGRFTDPLGPDITSAMYKFFELHPRSWDCQ